MLQTGSLIPTRGFHTATALHSLRKYLGCGTVSVLPSMPAIEQAKQQQNLQGKQGCVMGLS